MTDRFTPVARALVAASLLLATATLMLVAVNTARAAGALAIGAGYLWYKGAPTQSRSIAVVPGAGSVTITGRF